MRVKYLLPCSCGQKIAVESSQAGQSILCSCGKSMEVPTMKGLRQLEQYVDTANEPKATSSFGGSAIGIALLGFVILGAGAGFMTWMHFTQRPILIDMDYMSPWDTWLMWQSLREGVQLPEFAESPYFQAKKVYDQYMTVGAVIMALGGVTVAFATIVAIVNRSAKRRKISRSSPS